jgi:hypothetical protein
VLRLDLKGDVFRSVSRSDHIRRYVVFEVLAVQSVSGRPNRGKKDAVSRNTLYGIAGVLSAPLSDHLR